VRRGELYRVVRPAGDPRPVRVFIVASRNRFLDTGYGSATCVPVYSSVLGLDTEVELDDANGLKHPSAGRCDELQRVPRSQLRNFVGELSTTQLRQMSRALAVALEIAPTDIADL
jgi:mRNA-degrading endonuclease toxin of MazEF toxin-antitoxin module